LKYPAGNTLLQTSGNTLLQTSKYSAPDSRVFERFGAGRRVVLRSVAIYKCGF